MEYKRRELYGIFTLVNLWLNETAYCTFLESALLRALFLKITLVSSVPNHSGTSFRFPCTFLCRAEDTERSQLCEGKITKLIPGKFAWGSWGGIPQMLISLVSRVLL